MAGAIVKSLDGARGFQGYCYGCVIRLGMSILYFVPTILKTTGYTNVMACIILSLISSAVAKSAMICLLVVGFYTGLPMMFNWTSESVPFPDQKRLVAIAFVNPFGHLAIIYGSYLWPSTNAPEHLVAFAILAATCDFGYLIVVAATWYFQMLLQELVTRAERDLTMLQRLDQAMRKL
ncbi:hypothetical protein EDB82DRAFT_476589 [Fusarium venenatum]|nr:hypothetical protein EDB82DRAFT_476589 [Fusarium venenatum]